MKLIMKNNKLIIPTIPDLYRLTSKDYSKACEVLGLAFQEDPIWKAILKDDPDKFSLVFGVPLKYSLKYGVVLASSPNLEGIAAWLPSDYIKSSFFRFLMSGALWSAMKLGSKIGKLIQEVFEIITEDRETNMKGTYLYLYVIGVAPEHQGKGIGSRLINSMLTHLPPKVPIYLETETERNVKLYEKLGFKVLKKIMVPSLQLPMWEMLHDRK
jgi:ribosomal protein S18 acetylase RimI-like enzyme